MSHLKRAHGTRILRLSDLTPLVDVALVLVVFFLLNYQVAEVDALPVELPVAESSTSVVQAPLRITVLEDGALLIGDERVQLEDLSARAKGQRSVAVAADGRCRYARVVQVVDRLRQAGVTEITSITKPLGGIEQWDR